MVDKISPLGPVDPASLPPVDETEKVAPWVIRKLVGSMTGRIVMSSYESLRAAGTNVICLSPWGDSSPLFLPCIRFRDLAIHTVIAATGGMAAVAAPAMGPISDVVLSSAGDSILVELGLDSGFALPTKAANELVFRHTVNKLIPIHSKLLATTAAKVLLITLRYKKIMEDAALGFYRSSLHKDISLFSSIKDYLAVEKGWFSPYLFASARRPIIPRSMKPDIIFCHGPFLSGDYRIGETLLSESAIVIPLCDAPMSLISDSSKPPHQSLKEEEQTLATGEESGGREGHHHSLHERFSSLSLPTLKKHLAHRSRTPSPDPSLTRLPKPTLPRRLVILFIGLKPHRKLWTTSARPGESVINYILFNGCPAIVVPVKIGAPLVAWYAGMTLEQMWKVELPENMEAKDCDLGFGKGDPRRREGEESVGAGDDDKDDGDGDDNGSGGSGVTGVSSGGGDEAFGSTIGATKTFGNIVQVLFEYLDLCVDWERMKVPDGNDNEAADQPVSGSSSGSGSGLVSGYGGGDDKQGKSVEKELKKKKMVLRNSLALLTAAVVRSRSSSQEAMKEVDSERSGIAMWRIP